MSPHVVFFIFLLLSVFASYKTGKLTLAASVTGGVVATSIYLGAGFGGIAMLAAFFILATLATRWGKKQKANIVAGEHHSEKRDTGQVLANGLTAAILGLAMYVTRKDVFGPLMAATLASATADTLSSELGTVYGRRFYNIITFKRDAKGRDGVISPEGTLIGVSGSAVIALIYSLAVGNWASFAAIVIAGTIGNLSDSILGATLERRGYLGNNGVNFLNTFIASVICYLIVIYIL